MRSPRTPTAGVYRFDWVCAALLLSIGASGAHAFTPPRIYHGGVASGTAGVTVYRRADIARSIYDSLHTSDTTKNRQRAEALLAQQPIVFAFLQKPFEAAIPDWSALQNGLRVVSTSPGVHGNLFTAQVNLQGLVPGLPAATGGLPTEAAILNGLADFLVQRAEDEVVVAYLADLQTELRQFPFAGAAFPATVTLLNSATLTSASGLVGGIRAAALRDYEQLPEHFGAVLDSFYGPSAAIDSILRLSNNDSIVASLRNTSAVTLVNLLTAAKPKSGSKNLVDAFKKEVAVRDRIGAIVHAVAIVAEPVRRIRGGADAASALASLADLSPTDVADVQARVALAIVGLTCREVANDEGNLGSLLSDDDQLRTYFAAFAAAEIGAIAKDTAHPTAEADIRKVFAAEPEPLFALIAQIGDARTQINALRAAHREHPDSISSTELEAQSVQVLFGLLDALRHVAPDLKALQWQSDRQAITGPLAFLPVVQDLTSNLHSANYTRVAVTVIQLFQSDSLIIPQRVSHIMMFAASIAEATDAAGVNQALEAAALPVGSYRLKRVAQDNGKKRYSLSLNGYVGAGGGWELPIQRVAVSKGAGQASLAAPVGFEFSWSSGGGSGGIFVPLIDLGALTAVRFAEDSLQNTATVGFGQVFAPGFFLMWGVGDKTPFSLGIGGELAPNLRSVKTRTDEAVSTLRLSIMAAIDVPIFRF